MERASIVGGGKGGDSRSLFAKGSRARSDVSWKGAETRCGDASLARCAIREPRRMRNKPDAG